MSKAAAGSGIGTRRVSIAASGLDPAAAPAAGAGVAVATAVSPPCPWEFSCFCSVPVAVGSSFGSLDFCTKLLVTRSR